MMVELWLIRHGMTPGNALGKYVGRTDEPLSARGRDILAKRQAGGFYPDLEYVYVSPMKRCRETAAVIFPAAGLHVLEGMQECDFGDFEYKNYEELNGQPAYQAWIDSGGTAGFPGGETLLGFQDRVIQAFDDMIELLIEKYHHQRRGWQRDCQGTVVIGGMQREALVIHGGTIMAILDCYARPHKEYFEWQAKNGCGYVVKLDIAKWESGERFLEVQSAIEAPES